MAGKKDPVVTKPPQLSLRLRLALSVLLLAHVMAVFFPPFTFATSWTGLASPFAEPIMRTIRPYVDLLFLDHGYFFFAPNPGPSHLLRARLEFADGRPPQELLFPDRNHHQPRLFYHRHFMLAEQFHGDFAPPRPPQEVADDPEQVARWRRARDIYELRSKSIENHLRETYGAERVTLTRIEHELPAPGEFLDLHQALNASESYHDLPEDTAEPPSPRMVP